MVLSFLLNLSRSLFNVVFLLQDFLRQNNTGKLLWQLFGIRAATMCVFGIPEQEEIMWDAFKSSGFTFFISM